MARRRVDRAGVREVAEGGPRSIADTPVRQEVRTGGSGRMYRPSLVARGDGWVAGHRVKASEWVRRVGECAGAALGRGFVLERGSHHTSWIQPLAQPSRGARVPAPPDGGEFEKCLEKYLMVSANGNTPIIFLSDAAEPRCIRNGLQSGEAAPSIDTAGAASGSPSVLCGAAENSRRQTRVRNRPSRRLREA
jgi:hypothetical protein